MKLLALDTSSDACSVALQLDDVVLEQHVVQPKQHSRSLLPMIEAVLAEAAIGIDDLDAIVVGNGPGSFIGVRIAVSVAQGLAFAARLKVVPVSSLSAVAAEAMSVGDARRVVVAQDAHMQEVYLGRYEGEAGGMPRAVGEVRLHGIGPVQCLAGTQAGRWFAAGAGWSRYPELLRSNRSGLAGVLEVRLPRARFLLTAGSDACRAGLLVPPEQLVPAYVRQQVAQVPKGA